MNIKKELKKMWDNNNNYKKLEYIEFNEKGIRGIKNFKIEFKYPITAIAGPNGVGKTTILQTIACLFHNNDKNFKPYRLSNAKHQSSYYTFSDFFIFTKDEIKFEKGIEIKYFYEKEYKITRKNRWTKYERRPKRYVDYFGVSRVLPSYEFSTFKNTFKGNYSSLKTRVLEDSNKEEISSILNKPLNNIEEISSKNVINFKLNNIEDEYGIKYSSFNMGAGEEVAISLISRIDSLPQNSLVLIEEIELGLHPLAQKRLINILMKIAYEKKLQIIFTTHSPFVFKELPKEAKILLRKNFQDIEVFYGASESMAFMELTGDSSKDLTVYVEDMVAKNIVENLFNSEIRKRIQIMDVGDYVNVIKMLSAHITNQHLGNVIAILDGDVNDNEIKNNCKNHCRVSSEKAKEYINVNILKLPGNLPPEKYILKKLKEDSEFRKKIDDSVGFERFIKTISLEDHHELFFKIAQYLNIDDKEKVKNKIIDILTERYKDEFLKIVNKIKEHLNI